MGSGAKMIGDEKDGSGGVAGKESADSERVEFFPQKLLRVLSELEMAGLSHIFSWMPHGRSFRVHKRRLFVEVVAPRYFGGSTKYESFQRQLTCYGFTWIRDGPDKGGYFHEKFVRGMPYHLANLKRVRKKGHGPRKRATKPPDFYFGMTWRPSSISPSVDTISEGEWWTRAGQSMSAEIPPFGCFQDLYYGGPPTQADMPSEVLSGGGRIQMATTDAVVDRNRTTTATTQVGGGPASTKASRRPTAGGTKLFSVQSGGAAVRAQPTSTTVLDRNRSSTTRGEDTVQELVSSPVTSNAQANLPANLEPGAWGCLSLQARACGKIKKKSPPNGSTAVPTHPLPPLLGSNRSEDTKLMPRMAPALPTGNKKSASEGSLMATQPPMPPFRGSNQSEDAKTRPVTAPILPAPAGRNKKSAPNGCFTTVATLPPVSPLVRSIWSEDAKMRAPTAPTLPAIAGRNKMSAPRGTLTTVAAKPPMPTFGSSYPSKEVKPLTKPGAPTLPAIAGRNKKSAPKGSLTMVAAQPLMPTFGRSNRSKEVKPLTKPPPPEAIKHKDKSDVWSHSLWQNLEEFCGITPEGPPHTLLQAGRSVEGCSKEDQTRSNCSSDGFLQPVAMDGNTKAEITKPYSFFQVAGGGRSQAAPVAAFTPEPCPMQVLSVHDHLPETRNDSIDSRAGATLPRDGRAPVARNKKQPQRACVHQSGSVARAAVISPVNCGVVQVAEACKDGPPSKRNKLGACLTAKENDVATSPTADVRLVPLLSGASLEHHKVLPIMVPPTERRNSSICLAPHMDFPGRGQRPVAEFDRELAVAHFRSSLSEAYQAGMAAAFKEMKVVRLAPQVSTSRRQSIVFVNDTSEGWSNESSYHHSTPDMPSFSPDVSITQEEWDCDECDLMNVFL